VKVSALTLEHTYEYYIFNHWKANKLIMYSVSLAVDSKNDDLLLLFVFPFIIHSFRSLSNHRPDWLTSSDLYEELHCLDGLNVNAKVSHEISQYLTFSGSLNERFQLLNCP